MSHEHVRNLQIHIAEATDKIVVQMEKLSGQESPWKRSSVQNALALFWPIFEDKKPTAVYASIGSSPEEDETTDKSGLPNALRIIPVLDEQVSFWEEQAAYHGVEAEWYTKNPTNEKRLSIIPLFMRDLRERGIPLSNFPEKIDDHIKIFPTK